MKLGVGSCLVSEAAPTQAIHSQHIALLFLAIYGSGKDPTISFPHDEDNFGPSPSSLFIIVILSQITKSILDQQTSQQIHGAMKEKENHMTFLC